MTRGYSRAFPVKGKRSTYLLPDIPAGFWVAVRAKAKREGVSMRGLILQLLDTWVNEPAPDGKRDCKVGK